MKRGIFLQIPTIPALPGGRKKLREQKKRGPRRERLSRRGCVGEKEGDEKEENFPRLWRGLLFREEIRAEEEAATSIKENSPPQQISDSGSGVRGKRKTRSRRPRGIRVLRLKIQTPWNCR